MRERHSFVTLVNAVRYGTAYTHTHTSTHTNTHAHTHSHTRFLFFLAHFFCFTRSLENIKAHSHPYRCVYSCSNIDIRQHINTQACIATHSLSLSHFLSFSLSLSLSHTHIYKQSNTNTHTLL